MFAVYLYVTNLKGVSSMKLHRDLEITQKSAWFMLQRLREGWDASGLEQFVGPVEVDETFIGGLDRNKHANKKPRAGRGPVSKTAVVGAKDRETNRVSAAVTTDKLNAKTLQGFVHDHARPGATVYTDDAAAYRGMCGVEHEAVRHGVGEYGVAPHMSDYADDEAFRPADAEPVDVVQVVRKAQAEILICYLPVGSERGVHYYAQVCQHAVFPHYAFLLPSSLGV